MAAQRAHELIFTQEPPLGTLEERALATAFKSGVPDAYRTIHDRYAPRVHSVCRRMLHNPDDAAEAAQETFLRVYQGLPAFNGRYRLGAWVVRIATNVCLDQIRSRSRRPADLAPRELLDLESAPVDDSDPAIVFMRNAEGRRVRKILQQLPPMHRAAIVLRDFEGVSYAEIADVLGITECQVKALLHRARRRFKREWTSSLASVIAPLIALKRIFRPVKSNAAAHLTPASQTAETAITTSQQISATAAQAVQSCSGLIHGCGQFLSEKAAPVVTAVVVGTATVGAVAVDRSNNEESSPPAVQQVAPAVTTDLSTQSQDPAAKPSAPSISRSADSSTDSSAPVEDTSQEPAAEEPLPEETATPEPTPPPTDASGGIEPEPSPPPVPVIPEPQDFVFSFLSDLPGEGEPCSCVPSGTEVVNARILVTEGDGLLYLDHTTRSFASAGDTPFYALELRQVIREGRGHSMDFVLQRPEGMFRYAATGDRVEKQRTEWGGWLYRYSGTYRLFSRPGGSEVVPLAGTYTAEVTVSWQQNRVLSSAVSLTEG